MFLLFAALLAHADEKAPPTPPTEKPPAATTEEEAASLDDGADLDAEEGHLPDDAVPSVLKKNEWAFTDCYSRLGGTTSGRALFTWEVTLTGAAANVKITETDLKNPLLEACLVKAVGRMKFPVPRGGTVHVSHTFNF